MKTDRLDVTLAAIRKLGLPTQKYARLLARQEQDLKKAEEKHRALGRIVTAHVLARFRRGLPSTPSRRITIECQSRGYSIDWTRNARGESAVPTPVKPYLSLCIGIRGKHERSDINIVCWPTSASALNAWCERWIEWIKNIQLS